MEHAVAVVSSAKRAPEVGLIYPRVSGEGPVLKVYRALSAQVFDTGIKGEGQALFVRVFPVSANVPSGSGCATKARRVFRAASTSAMLSAIG